MPKSPQIKFGIWRIDQLVEEAPGDAWQGLSCNDGAKSPRAYGWAVARLPANVIFDPDPPIHHRWAMARRSLSDPASSPTTSPGPARPGLPRCPRSPDPRHRIGGSRTSINPLTAAEIRRLLDTFLAHPRPHQATARRCYYQRNPAQDTIFDWSTKGPTRPRPVDAMQWPTSLRVARRRTDRCLRGYSAAYRATPARCQGRWPHFPCAARFGTETQ